MSLFISLSLSSRLNVLFILLLCHQVNNTWFHLSVGNSFFFTNK
ncbi:hypothetical protein MED222_04870 [Vibrio sp. MED222]|nr:hypothetical protein MED222_04870 [Vibrio sp. MED222]